MQNGSFVNQLQPSTSKVECKFECKNLQVNQYFGQVKALGSIYLIERIDRAEAKR